MNIKEAKKQILDSTKAYLEKDEFDNYLIPIESQRPIFLMGPPGIGKTAILHQISQELGIGLVCYSMTHHTRQSALGLPVILNKSFEGYDYQVSEYTMSEIISSIYDLMKETNLREGILFLDEINCISETLAPAMLQFLQYKTFGKHKIPDGWIVVTAGNPPEFNKSVRDYDVVTWDRLRRIDCEADFDVWKEYAINKNVHPAILSFLEFKHDCFYHIGTTVDGKQIATARGWEDLSKVMFVYEKLKMDINLALINQFIQDERIANQFASYLILFKKYQADYDITSILDGTYDTTIMSNARNASYEERVSIVTMLINRINDAVKKNIIEYNGLLKFKNIGIELKNQKDSSNFDMIINNKIVDISSDIQNGKKSSSLSSDVLQELNIAKKELEYVLKAGHFSSMNDVVDHIRKSLQVKGTNNIKHANNISEQMSNAIHFVVEAFGEDQELVILLTAFTVNRYSSLHLSRHGCDEYFEYSKNLKISGTFSKLRNEVDDILN